MKFEKVDDIMGLYNRRVADVVVSGKLLKMEVGIYPVMWGYRVRIGVFNPEVESYCTTYEVDLCCGNSASAVSVIYTAVLSLLSDYDKFGHISDIEYLFPVFKIKPIWQNEDEFANFIKEIRIKEEYTIAVTDADLLSYKNNNLQNL